MSVSLAQGDTRTVDAALRVVEVADRSVDGLWSSCATVADLRRVQATVRAKVMESLGSLPEKCPLDARVCDRIRRDGYVIEKVIFASEPNHHVTAHLFLPDAEKFPGRRPGLVVPCGHSVAGKCAASYQRGGVLSAKRGFVTLVYDPVDQGERHQNCRQAHLWGTGAHNEIGRRAELLGWSAARFRLRDGMRALDYLCSRREVDPERLGVMGHSGGGTMTSWIMALDDRIRCAAPSGYLSTQRDVCNAIGPQDAEQYVFGELAFGFNHLGHILMRAPSPVLMCTSEKDFFPIAGSHVTADLAARVYGAIGAPDAFRLSQVAGEHMWHESTINFAVDWMDWKLQQGPEPKTLAAYRALDDGRAGAKVDTGLSAAPKDYVEWRNRSWEGNVTPMGSTLALAGERTVYDQMRDEMWRQAKARKPLTPETVRRVAGIRKAADIPFESVSDRTFKTDDGIPISLCCLGTGTVSVLFVSDGSPYAPRPHERISSVDIRGFGANGGIRHDFYGTGCGDEELAVLYHLLGRKLVGKRAEDIIAAAKFMGNRPTLKAKGRAVIPAAHAYYTARELFSGLELVDRPPSWADYLTDDGQKGHFADVVRGAWACYDWVELK